MKLHRLTVLAATVLVTNPAASADPESATKRKEEAIVAELRHQLKCESIQRLKDGNLYCKLTYRGLSVEFAGVNSAGGGSVYIHSMGANQMITNLGARCLLVVFNDPDLRPEGIGAHILLRDDATISSNHSNPKARKGCE